ncbi:hypothetical protein ARMGADRAFT_73570 [Armillaria gallica]|uniref:Uncharacterized protein n=1 Tax=Armillaria gallica TaxID=47427 RepID=A0A2H3DIG3_ARMGA|nr:hypothetical protein ARMGADRAFT_73570 [Armillaria gallica]
MPTDPYTRRSREGVVKTFHTEIGQCAAAAVSASFNLLDSQGSSVFPSESRTSTIHNGFKSCVSSMTYRLFFRDCGRENRSRTCADVKPSVHLFALSFHIACLKSCKPVNGPVHVT